MGPQGPSKKYAGTTLFKAQLLKMLLILKGIDSHNNNNQDNLLPHSIR